MKLTYWYCRNLWDDNKYSIRTKTKKEAVDQRGSDHDGFAKPVKVVVLFDNPLHLVKECMWDEVTTAETDAWRAGC